MILPTKHINTRHSLLGSGATILQSLEQEKTVNALWQVAKLEPNIGTYSRYVLTLDFLFCIGAIEIQNGLITKRKS